MCIRDSGTICALIAQPYLEDEQDQTSYWVEENIYESEDHITLIEGLPEDAEVQRFSITTAHDSGTDDEVRSYPSLWTLIDHLNKAGDKAIVYSHSLHKDFIGPKITPKDHINWQILPLKNTTSPTYTINNDRHQLGWKIESLDKQLAATTTSLGSSASQNSQPLQIHLASSDETSTERFVHLLDLTKEFLLYDVDIAKTPEQDADIIITLNETSAPSAGQPVINWTSSDAPLKVDRLNKSTLHITGDINRENIIDTNLPILLASFLTQHYTNIYDRDLRVLDPTTAPYMSATHQAPEEARASIVKRPLHLELLALLALLIIGERLYAHQLADPS